MRDNTQNGGASSILHGSAKTTLKALETRQLSLALPCTKSGQVGEVERETGKFKAKGHPSAHAKQKELKLNATLPHRQNEKLNLNATLPLPQKEKFIPHEDRPFLQIQGVPITQRVDPDRNSYVLMIQPVGVRACGGQFAASEAYEIARLTKGWDWRLDPDDKPRCLGRLEALLERICKRSVLGNEASEAGLFLTYPLPANQDSLDKFKPKPTPSNEGDPSGEIAKSKAAEGIDGFEPSSETGRRGLNLTKPLPADQASLVKNIQNEGGEI